MNDRIRELDIFLRVTEAASFSAAARSLDCAPSTISKVIQRLENRLGVRMFHRTSRVLKLTQEGELFLAGAQRVVTALEDAEQSLGSYKAQATGVLRVNSTPAFARYHLAPIMAEFCERNPMLKVEFVLTVTPPDIFEQQIDVSIQSGHIADSTLVAKRVTSTRWIMCAGPAYLKRAGVPRTVDDLARHNCLNFMPGSFRSHWPVKAGGKTETLEMQGNISANNGDMLRALACAGMGIARLADHHVGAEIAAGKLVPVLQEFQLELPEPVFAVYGSKRNLSPRVKVFLDYLVEKLSRDGKAR
jgi:DNA-binding transcriptional LysR family regulator